MAKNADMVKGAPIENRILLVRGQRVMLDRDLAELHGVETKRLNEQVHRNRDRFPTDFMFPLTKSEKEEVAANCDHLGPLKYSPSRADPLPVVRKPEEGARVQKQHHGSGQPVRRATRAAS
jgi:hypothetical protein